MTIDLLKSIGKRIYTKRKELGFTQEYLADKMNVSIQMVSNLERGNKAIKIDNLIKISEILGVSTDYILKGQNTNSDCTVLSDKLSLLEFDDYKMIEMLIEYCINKKD